VSGTCCLYISNEDPEEEIKARVAAGGGNPDKVAVISGAVLMPQNNQVIEDLIVTDGIPRHRRHPRGRSP
jgi:hypothetical protein